MTALTAATQVYKAVEQFTTDAMFGCVRIGDEQLYAFLQFVQPLPYATTDLVIYASHEMLVAWLQRIGAQYRTNDTVDYDVRNPPEQLYIELPIDGVCGYGVKDVYPVFATDVVILTPFGMRKMKALAVPSVFVIVNVSQSEKPEYVLSYRGEK